MQTLVRLFVALLLIILGVFAISNLQQVQIGFPGIQQVSLSLAAASVMFFTLGFLTACAWLSIGMVRRYFIIRGLKKRIQELETRLPVVDIPSNNPDKTIL